MTRRKHSRPVCRRLALSDLIARRDRATVLSERARRALTDHISRLGCYPPLIVRRHPDRAGKYEILDGHHRAEVLRGLGETTARCEIWPVDSHEAGVLTATLNRLRGRADVKRQARQVRRLLRRLGPQRAAAGLGITPAALRRQLAAGDAPRRAEPGEGLDLRPVVFHLSCEQERRLRKVLDRAGRGRLGRGRALMHALRSPSTPPSDRPRRGE